MPLSTENRTGTLRWSKESARLSCDSPKAPSRRPQGSLEICRTPGGYRPGSLRLRCDAKFSRAAISRRLRIPSLNLDIDINTWTAGAYPGFGNGGGRFLVKWVTYIRAKRVTSEASDERSELQAKRVTSEASYEGSEYNSGGGGGSGGRCKPPPRGGF